MKVSTVFAIAAAASFSFGFLTTLHSAERFDNRIRSDFFRGLQGDPAALQRGLEACEKILALNPKAAEALVWHGSGTFFLAGQAFRDGDPGKGAALGGKGLREMEEAVALEPDNLAVRIPRGATLLFASRAMRPERARPLREKSRGDYELALARQKDIFDRLGVHPRGE
ncbi:MAG: hypothetical protein NTY38_24210, partial [Acidobacteria bacterium]|nr:hypothetical protein [Acidobacteriota bacterium]